MYSLKEKQKNTEKKLKRWTYSKNYKIFKKSFFRSVRWYDIIHYCIKYEGVCWYIWKNFTKKKNRINIESLVFVKELSISLTVLKRVYLWLLNKGQWRKKYVFASTSRPHEQIGFKVSWKLCLNLCSRKWLRSRLSLARYLITLLLWQLKTLFADGLINFTNSFWKF